MIIRTPHALLPSSEWARAKINLTLHVRGRRADGFHELDSLVVFAALGDRVTLTAGPKSVVTVTGPFAASIDGENLAARALALLSRHAPHLRLGAIAIDKQLPVAAGLGGGSADAAAVLRLLQQMNPEKSAGVDWHAMAAHLGSDVPVCFASQATRMTGRGETLAPLSNMPAFHAVLINPQTPVPADKTTQVFRRLAAPLFDGLTPTVFKEPLTTAAWLDGLNQSRNDLEAPATAVIPAIAEVLATIRADPRTRLARLSGAGPTCFALTQSGDAARGLAADLVAQHPSWWIRATRLG